MDLACPPSPRLRFPDSRELTADHLIASNESSTAKVSRHTWPWKSFSSFSEMPWLGWLFVYAFVQFFISTCRCIALKALVNMYGVPQDYTVAVKASALSLGFLEDFVCTTYLATILWLVDTMKRPIKDRFGDTLAALSTFTVSWMLFLVVMAPIVADLVLVVYRDVRFSSNVFFSILRERHHLKAAPISTEELHHVYWAVAFLVELATLFALVRAMAAWADLSLWNPTELVSLAFSSSSSVLKQRVNIKAAMEKSTGGVKYTALALEEGSDAFSAHEIRGTTPFKSSNNDLGFEKRHPKCHVGQVSTLLLGLVVIPTLVVAIRCVCSPLVVYAALNVTLNELFFHAFEPTAEVFHPVSLADKYVDDFEVYDQFGNNTLYRRTTGFKGDLAFNITIDSGNPPNVLIIGVESFRFRDSRYLVGTEDPSNLFKGTNGTITPNFDRWAQRGVAFRNIWSSIPTSRSLESLLFAQIPYNEGANTGITGGKLDTELAGLPQLFAQKGYDTFFTTGSPIVWDNWNLFLPSHGFSNVWSENKMKELAEKTLHIDPRDWYGAEHRQFVWGVHDDLSFQILGNLLVEKQRERQDHLAKGEYNKPVFVTHYTISSHEDFSAWPRWYDQIEKPDFSRLYQGERNAKKVKNYLNLRYFTDMELGKFMDRMQTEGVLNDTIVIIVGDHGQAPESDNPNIVEESCTRIPAAIIAEGRLGDAVGLVIDDVAEQYDMLNTLADITGLPKGGFIQTGVGRSLKRKVPSSDRVVYSNDPLRKMSIVHGHLRLRYDAVTDAIMLHNTETDFHMTHDLFPDLPLEEQAKWKEWREDGRRITAYYKKRWDGKCLLAVNCNM